MAGVWNRNLQGYLRAKAIGFAEQGYATIYGTNGNPIATTKPSGTDNVYGFLGTNIAALMVYAYGSPDNNYPFRMSGARMLLAFGSGDDTPSVNDYKLESYVRPAINNLTHGAYFYASGVASRTITVTVQNPNVTAMTISEWGLFGGVYDNQNSVSSTTSTGVLLYRALLDTPVTLQQYESATFTLTLQLTVAAES